MKLETFFEKFDQFADAPGAVAKMRDNAEWIAPSGLRLIVDAIPRAFPWVWVAALALRIRAPTGHPKAAWGNAPGKPSPIHFNP